MNWLHEHGVISGFEEYERLPLAVLDDARMWMDADLAHRAKEAEKARSNSGKRR